MATMSSTNRRRSPSPAHTQQPLSKRDKKRSQIENRAKELLATRNANRDSNLRAQLNALSRDIQYINRADLYQNQPLGDAPDDLMAEVASIPASGSGEPEITKVPLGKNAAQFVDDINDAMEERDASLTSVHVSSDSLRPSELLLEHPRTDSELADTLQEAAGIFQNGARLLNRGG